MSASKQPLPTFAMEDVPMYTSTFTSPALHSALPVAPPRSLQFAHNSNNHNNFNASTTTGRSPVSFPQSPLQLQGGHRPGSHHRLPPINNNSFTTQCTSPTGSIGSFALSDVDLGEAPLKNKSFAGFQRRAARDVSLLALLQHAHALPTPTIIPDAATEAAVCSFLCDVKATLDEAAHATTTVECWDPSVVAPDACPAATAVDLSWRTHAPGAVQTALKQLPRLRRIAVVENTAVLADGAALLTEVLATVADPEITQTPLHKAEESGEENRIEELRLHVSNTAFLPTSLLRSTTAPQLRRLSLSPQIASSEAALVLLARWAPKVTSLAFSAPLTDTTVAILLRVLTRPDRGFPSTPVHTFKLPSPQLAIAAASSTGKLTISASPGSAAVSPTTTTGAANVAPTGKKYDSVPPSAVATPAERVASGHSGHSARSAAAAVKCEHWRSLEQLTIAGSVPACAALAGARPWRVLAVKIVAPSSTVEFRKCLPHAAPQGQSANHHLKDNHLDAAVLSDSALMTPPSCASVAASSMVSPLCLTPVMSPPAALRETSAGSPLAGVPGSGNNAAGTPSPGLRAFSEGRVASALADVSSPFGLGSPPPMSVPANPSLEEFTIDVDCPRPPAALWRSFGIDRSAAPNLRKLSFIALPFGLPMPNGPFSERVEELHVPDVDVLVGWRGCPSSVSVLSAAIVPPLCSAVLRRLPMYKNVTTVVCCPTTQAPVSCFGRVQVQERYQKTTEGSLVQLPVPPLVSLASIWAGF